MLLARLPTSISDPVHPAWNAFPFIVRTSTDQPVLPLPLGFGYITSFSWWENSAHNIEEGLKCLHSGMSLTPLRISYHPHKIPGLLTHLGQTEDACLSVTWKTDGATDSHAIGLQSADRRSWHELDLKPLKLGMGFYIPVMSRYILCIRPWHPVHSSFKTRLPCHSLSLAPFLLNYLLLSHTYYFIFRFP